MENFELFSCAWTQIFWSNKDSSLQWLFLEPKTMMDKNILRFYIPTWAGVVHTDCL